MSAEGRVALSCEIAGKSLNRRSFRVRWELQQEWVASSSAPLKQATADFLMWGSVHEARATPPARQLDYRPDLPSLCPPFVTVCHTLTCHCLPDAPSSCRSRITGKKPLKVKDRAAMARPCPQISEKLQHAAVSGQAGSKGQDRNMHSSHAQGACRDKRDQQLGTMLTNILGIKLGHR